MAGRSIIPEPRRLGAALEWLSRARSDLALARAKPKGVYLEDLCFHAQQAAEKAIKALLICHRVQFPYVHDLAALLTLLERATGELPEHIRQAERLTQFAVRARYPGTGAPPGSGQAGRRSPALGTEATQRCPGLSDRPSRKTIVL